MSAEQSSEQFGDYRIAKEIARGGMASVSLAFQTTSVGLERRVVIKSVLPHMTSNQDFVTMFVDEARLMMSFSHPHIAQVFEAGELDGRNFIAMEYVHGVTLSQMIKVARKSGEHIPYEVAFGLAIALSEALTYVHQRCDEYGNWLSIIHRDLKPSNVLVGFDGVVKLIDFGIAQAASKQHHTKTGVLKGTIGYLAPEQILDEPVDQRADVFTLGLLLYQAFLGRYPFPGKNDAQRLRALINGAPLEPQSCRADCPERLARLLLRCLASSPAERLYMRELVHELAACAREMSLAPHFQVISDWVSGNLRSVNEKESNPEQLLQPALGKLRASLQEPSRGEMVPTLVNHDSNPSVERRSRERVIEAKLDELDPLFDSATLFDVSVHFARDEDSTPNGASISQMKAAETMRLEEAKALVAEAQSISVAQPAPQSPHDIKTRPVELSELPESQLHRSLRATTAEQITGEMFQPSPEELEYTNIIDRKRLKEGRKAAQSASLTLSPRQRRAFIIGAVLIALAVCAAFAYLLAS